MSFNLHGRSFVNELDFTPDSDVVRWTGTGTSSSSTARMNEFAASQWPP
jgi:hypothetical protein